MHFILDRYTTLCKKTFSLAIYHNRTNDRLPLTPSTTQATCLSNEPRSVKEYVFPEKLPGELYDADTQCKWQFGKKAKLCNLHFKKVRGPAHLLHGGGRGARPLTAWGRAGDPPAYCVSRGAGGPPTYCMGGALGPPTYYIGGARPRNVPFGLIAPASEECQWMAEMTGIPIAPPKSSWED